MRFWNEMRQKYGFNDGESVPDGANIYRTVYVQVVNELAEQMGSRVRAIGYDRPGVHNPCMIVFLRDEDWNGISADQQVIGNWTADPCEPDQQMREAIDLANAHDIDQFIVTDPSVNEDGLASFLDSVVVRDENNLPPGD